MGTVSEYFFDTYAFCEILAGNPRYAAFKVGSGVVTARMNLLELHYSVLLKSGKAAADKWYDGFLPYAIEMSDAVLKDASSLKARFKSRKLSYVDCIGYVLAKSLGLRFLTGDEQFRDLENVEFVK